MASLRSRFIVADDLRPEQTWQLLDWCREHGAEEMALQLLWLDGHPRPIVTAVEEALTPYRLPAIDRPHMTALVGQSLIRPTQRWRLAEGSVAVLREYFRKGLFTYPVAEWTEGALEDPVFYRGGEIMLGVVSHEREGVLALTEREHEAVAALGIPSRDRPAWI